MKQEDDLHGPTGSPEMHGDPSALETTTQEPNTSPSDAGVYAEAISRVDRLIHDGTLRGARRHATAADRSKGRRDPNASTAGLEFGTPEWHKARGRAARRSYVRNRQMSGGGLTEKEIAAYEGKRGKVSPALRQHIDRLKTTMKPTRLWWTAFGLFWAWLGERTRNDLGRQPPMPPTQHP